MASISFTGVVPRQLFAPNGQAYQLPNPTFHPNGYVPHPLQLNGTVPHLPSPSTVQKYIAGGGTTGGNVAMGNGLPTTIKKPSPLLKWIAG